MKSTKFVTPAKAGVQNLYGQALRNRIKENSHCCHYNGHCCEHYVKRQKGGGIRISLLKDVFDFEKDAIVIINVPEGRLVTATWSFRS